MKHKPKPRWTKQILTLGDKHTWKAPPGYNIFAADRGAVRFNFPHGWVVVPASDCIELYDRQPPDDDCRLAVSYLRLPPIDWSGLPLAQLITTVVEGDHREVLARGDIVSVPRANLITFDFWADDAPRLLPVWDEVMRSVELGRYVEDPTTGDILH